MRQYKERISALIQMAGGKCVRCGSTVDLQFDHIDPSTKNFTITKGWALAWDRVLAEVKKCQLLCRECHDKKSIAAGDIPPRAVHGTEAMYRHHDCRCTLCKEAHRDKMRLYRASITGV